MGIVHTRIDDRLIHGQVVAYWVNSLNIHRIMVANDKVATNDLQKSTLRLAVPPGIRTSIITKKKAATNIKAGKYDKQRVFLILEDPQDAIDLINLGVKLDTINIGNLAHKEGAIQIKTNIKVTKDQIQAFKELHERGIKLTARMVPGDPKVDFINYLKKVID
ncbi:PTS sugar transporter subunit IIB [Schnuerera sp. xch1]|uniref:PTS system mannose/fructose/N-acetylgalactosamine-transporter subunit IIB n=1 Tax=Schnuerera sp. xch1 TaxID=2874283 RepID=UPI001CBED076|nr:PTS sugar transporter subunit IIB [Schnuerera sp. xch1]MBZ2174957.1 PTS sugar transporter subunit IIB [Schnuerera sp. xch1]